MSSEIGTSVKCWDAQNGGHGARQEIMVQLTDAGDMYRVDHLDTYIFGTMGEAEAFAKKVRERSAKTAGLVYEEIDPE